MQRPALVRIITLTISLGDAVWGCQSALGLPSVLCENIGPTPTSHGPVPVPDPETRARRPKDENFNWAAKDGGKSENRV